MQSNIKSEGFLKLQSKDPTDPPHIVLNYNKDPEDVKTWVNAFKTVVVPYVENLAKEEARFTELEEGNQAKIVKGGEGYFEKWIHPAESDFRTDGQFDEAKFTKFLERYVDGHHASSTCKMGPSSDPKAVVDQYGHVYGVKKLRICDASIFPEVPDMYIVGSVYMIGERMADLIKSEL